MKFFALTLFLLLTLVSYSEAYSRVDKKVDARLRQFIYDISDEPKVQVQHVKDPLASFYVEKKQQSSQKTEIVSNTEQTRHDFWTKGVTVKPAVKLTGNDVLALLVPKVAERLQSVGQSFSKDEFVHPSDPTQHASPLEAFTSSPLVKALLNPDAASASNAAAKTDALETMISEAKSAAADAQTPAAAGATQVRNDIWTKGVTVKPKVKHELLLHILSPSSPAIKEASSLSVAPEVQHEQRNPLNLRGDSSRPVPAAL